MTYHESRTDPYHIISDCFCTGLHQEAFVYNIVV